MKYLSVEEVLLIHTYELKKRGGRSGIKSIELLESAVHRPATAYGEIELYDTLFQKVASLIHALIKNHPFVDGNKRTAMVSGTIFLRMNGYILNISQTKYETVAVDIATNRLGIETLAKLLQRNSISPS